MHVDVSEADQIITWKINRPERINALGTTIALTLGELLDELHARVAPFFAERDSSPTNLPVRVLVITAEPARKGRAPVWVAGGDLKELSLLTTPTEGRAYAALFHRLCQGIERLPLPVIMAINGAAIGGGAELALAGDLRIATRESSFEFRQLRVGLATGYGCAKRLVDLVGKTRAQKYLYLGRELLAGEAQEVDLLHRVADDDEDLLRKVREVAKDMIALEPRAIAAQKEMFRLATDAHPGAASGGELDEFEKIWMNPSHRKFLHGFGDGRTTNGK